MLNEIEKLAVINQKADVQMSSEPVHQLSLYLFFVFVSLYFLICRKLCLLEYLNNLVVRLLCEK